MSDSGLLLAEVFLMFVPSLSWQTMIVKMGGHLKLNTQNGRFVLRFCLQRTIVQSSSALTLSIISSIKELLTVFAVRKRRFFASFLI